MHGVENRLAVAERDWISLRKLGSLVVLANVFCTLALASVDIAFDSAAKRWHFSNGVLEADFRVTPQTTFVLERIRDSASGRTWTAGPASAPFRLKLDQMTVDGTTSWSLGPHYQSCDASSCTEHIELLEATGQIQLLLEIVMYEGQPVIRHRVTVTNLGTSSASIRALDLLPYDLVQESAPLTAFHVRQWGYLPKPTQFETVQVQLNPSGTAELVQSGAAGQDCGWFAVADPNGFGLFGGWEFDGRVDGALRQDLNAQSLSIAAPLAEIFHPVASTEAFTSPWAFLGVFSGDFDEAGFRTQRFAETYLAQPLPGGNQFPYVSFDSWAYGSDLSEPSMVDAAKRAASLGVELFIIDLGWAKQIGEWHTDRTKFPSGMRAFSDYVHSLGMKFGLHFAFAEAASNSPVLAANPDWTSSETYGYFGASSLCLSNAPTRAWVIGEAVRMIDEYKVDWILQDGQNMVKRCTKTTHTHNPNDSNYSNAVDGVNAVLAEVQRQRPSVLWENCENGGGMMTFNMVKFYVTSITNDASGAFGSRKAVFGATYPFPSRFADCYMPEDLTDTYATRSYMFGGPWHLMNRMGEISVEASALAASEIAIYKQNRSAIRDGKTYHLQAPAAGGYDAIESYLESADRAITIVTRESADSDQYTLRLKGLKPGNSYSVHFQDDPRVLTMTGAQLMDNGIEMKFAQPQSAEIVYATAVRALSPLPENSNRPINQRK